MYDELEFEQCQLGSVKIYEHICVTATDQTRIGTYKSFGVSHKTGAQKIPT